MGSAFLCAEARIESTLSNSAAYLKGWIEALKGDKRMVVTAASAAQRAADFIPVNNVRKRDR
jgi:antirestriction protein ArdC